MKRVLKRAGQGATAAVAPFLWKLYRSSLLVIMYHRVLPADHPERQLEQPGMFVSSDTLEMHLDVLRRHFTLVHLDEWLDLVASGKSPPARCCAITFDDGWRDNYQYAFPILRQAQAPATIYLVSDLVGTQYSFWPNELGRLLSGGGTQVIARMPSWLRELVPNGLTGLNTELIDEFINQCKSRSDAEMLAVVDALSVGVATGSPKEQDLMSWDEIREMHATGFIKFGSHTRRHMRLPFLTSTDTLHEEIVGSLKAIQKHLGSAPTTFCYPNGDMSAEAVKMVRTTYRGAVTTMHGWNTTHSDPFVLKRVGVHEDVAFTRTAFLARLAGVG